MEEALGPGCQRSTRREQLGSKRGRGRDVSPLRGVRILPLSKLHTNGASIGRSRLRAAAAAHPTTVAQRPFTILVLSACIETNRRGINSLSKLSSEYRETPPGMSTRCAEHDAVQHTCMHHVPRNKFSTSHQLSMHVLPYSLQYPRSDEQTNRSCHWNRLRLHLTVPPYLLATSSLLQARTSKSIPKRDSFVRAGSSRAISFLPCSLPTHPIQPSAATLAGF